MTTIIAFISQKGGVGKSTLARAVAREASYSKMKVKIADLDTQQGTSVDWNRTRMGQGTEPLISVESFGTVAQALDVANQYDLLIIDGPARASKGTLEIALASDIVVQPSGASADDLKPAIREFHALLKQKVLLSRIVFALNRIGTNVEEAEARDYIQQAGYDVLDGFVPERPAYRKAQNTGKSITETSYAGLNQRADALIQSLIDRIH